uniref:CSON004102 protein n=1 Tax=Culicoides sonorensis TaxID=179676 RepID=A0A336LE85_CULSO
MVKRKKNRSKKKLKALELLTRQKNEENERLLEQENQRALQLQKEREHVIRGSMLNETMKQFEKIKSFMEVSRRQEIEEKQWQKYINCKTFPDPKSPPELRSFLFQCELDDIYKENHQINPRLLLNERSILTQDPNKPDLRLRTFQKVRPPIGDQYRKRIQQIIQINDELNHVLEIEKHNLPENIATDLRKLQLQFRSTLTSYLDKWSFEVLSNIDINMRFLDPITADYNYKCDEIKHFLWTFREVPLPPD